MSEFNDASLWTLQQLYSVLCSPHFVPLAHSGACYKLTWLPWEKCSDGLSFCWTGIWVWCCDPTNQSINHTVYKKYGSESLVTVTSFIDWNLHAYFARLWTPGFPSLKDVNYNTLTVTLYLIQHFMSVRKFISHRKGKNLNGIWRTVIFIVTGRCALAAKHHRNFIHWMLLIK